MTSRTDGFALHRFHGGANTVLHAAGKGQTCWGNDGFYIPRSGEIYSVGNRTKLNYNGGTSTLPIAKVLDVGHSYNFCWPVRTLREEVRPQVYHQQTPAISAGLDDHVWTFKEWLTFPAKIRQGILAHEELVAALEAA